MTSGALPEGSSKDAKARPRAAALKDVHRYRDVRHAGALYICCGEAVKKVVDLRVEAPPRQQADGLAFQLAYGDAHDAETVKSIRNARRSQRKREAS